MHTAYDKTPLLLPLIFQRMWLNWLRANFQRAWGRRHGLGGSTGMAIKIWGGNQKTSYKC